MSDHVDNHVDRFSQNVARIQGVQLRMVLVDNFSDCFYIFDLVHDVEAIYVNCYRYLIFFLKYE